MERGEKPAAGFEINRRHRAHGQADFLSSIASARQEAHTLFELSQDLGNSLSLDETLSLVAMRLRKLVPYDSIVVFVKKGDLLMPEFVSGDNFRLLSSLAIPIGTGSAAGSRRTQNPSSTETPPLKPALRHDTKDFNGAPLRPGCSPGRSHRARRRTGALPGRAGCVHQRPPARPPGHYFQGCAIY